MSGSALRRRACGAIAVAAQAALAGDDDGCTAVTGMDLRHHQ
jgi:hypothetical protein